MGYLILSFFFIFGVVVGSFLNVLILRYNTGYQLGGRSQCLSCSKILYWYELVPIVSYLFQSGKCRKCQSQISLQYPLVELITGVVFAFTVLEVGLAWPVVFYLALFSSLIALAVYDLKHKIIPDELSYFFIIGSFLLTFLFTPERVVSHLLAALVAFLFFFGLWFVSAGRWMGFGDAKLAIGIGVLLGPRETLTALVLAFWVGAAVGLLLLLLANIQRLVKKGGSRRGPLTGLFKAGSYPTIKSEIPFAPFLVLGTLLTFFFDFYVFFF